MARRTSILVGGLALLALCSTSVSGCRSSSSDVPVRLAEGHAQCLVCKSEGDLACVDVKLREDTPRSVYRGTTYYFCSTQCRSDFERHPELYVAR